MTTVRPTGRASVTSAILDVASELFAERGPAATSIREVAARSGVNHGLVYRHFGTKDALVAAVLDHMSNQLYEAVAASETRASSLAERQSRVLARTILDGYPVGEMQHRFPLVARLVAEASAHTEDEMAARLAAGQVVALELGWQLFEPFIRTATGTNRVSLHEIRQATHDLSQRILAAPERSP